MGQEIIVEIKGNQQVIEAYSGDDKPEEPFVLTKEELKALNTAFTDEENTFTKPQSINSGVLDSLRYYVSGIYTAAVRLTSQSWTLSHIAGSFIINFTFKNFYVNENGTFDLGLASKRWKDGWFAGFINVLGVKSATNDPTKVFATDGSEVDLPTGAMVVENSNRVIGADEGGGGSIFISTAAIQLTLPDTPKIGFRYSVINGGGFLGDFTVVPSGANTFAGWIKDSTGFSTSFTNKTLLTISSAATRGDRIDFTFTGVVWLVQAYTHNTGITTS